MIAANYIQLLKTWLFFSVRSLLVMNSYITADVFLLLSNCTVAHFFTHFYFCSSEDGPVLSGKSVPSVCPCITPLPAAITPCHSMGTHISHAAAVADPEEREQILTALSCTALSHFRLNFCHLLSKKGDCTDTCHLCTSRCKKDLLLLSLTTVQGRCVLRIKVTFGLRQECIWSFCCFTEVFISFVY